MVFSMGFQIKATLVMSSLHGLFDVFPDQSHVSHVFIICLSDVFSDKSHVSHVFITWSFRCVNIKLASMSSLHSQHFSACERLHYILHHTFFPHPSTLPLNEVLRFLPANVFIAFRICKPSQSANVSSTFRSRTSPLHLLLFFFLFFYFFSPPTGVYTFHLK